MFYAVNHARTESTVVEVDPSAVHPVPSPLFDTEAEATAHADKTRAAWLEKEYARAAPRADKSKPLSEDNPPKLSPAEWLAIAEADLQKLLKAT